MLGFEHFKKCSFFKHVYFHTSYIHSLINIYEVLQNSRIFLVKVVWFQPGLQNDMIHNHTPFCLAGVTLAMQEKFDNKWKMTLAMKGINARSSIETSLCLPMHLHLPRRADFRPQGVLQCRASAKTLLKRPDPSAASFREHPRQFNIEGSVCSRTIHVFRNMACKNWVGYIRGGTREILLWFSIQAKELKQSDWAKLSDLSNQSDDYNWSLFWVTDLLYKSVHLKNNCIGIYTLAHQDLPQHIFTGKTKTFPSE